MVSHCSCRVVIPSIYDGDNMQHLVMETDQGDSPFVELCIHQLGYFKAANCFAFTTLQLYQVRYKTKDDHSTKLLYFVNMKKPE